MNKKGMLIGIIGLVIVIGIASYLIIQNNLKEPDKPIEEQKEKPNDEPSINRGQSFSISILKEVNKANQKTNYLISPYSIEIALNMLKNGANNKTYNEIDKLINTREINDVSIKDRVSVANAFFVTERYQGKVENEYLDLMKNKYFSDIIYDSFSTPDKINEWVNDKTKGMIPKILENMNPNFALGIVNALAIDVDWYSSFSCSNTKEETFNKSDNKKINTEMMYQEYKGSAEYFETENGEGVIIPYAKYNKKTGEKVYEDEESNQLEFIAILPKNNLDNYINNLTEEELKNIDNNKKEASHKEKIELRIPRFSYDYEIEDFITTLKNLGIVEAFDDDKADFTKMVAKENQYGNLYVGEAVHKTHIDLNEKGTKAAAVTYIGMFDKAMMEEKAKIKKITFDKPFIYMIRDKKTKEILFIGTVYEPNIWKGKTCSEKEDTN